MKSSGFAVCLGLALLLWGPALATAQEDGLPGKSPILTSPDVPEIPSGFVVVNEDDVQILVEGIESDLRKAQGEAFAGRLAPAANNLRKAAAAIRMEGSRVPRSERAGLAAASDSVEAVAVVLKDGGSVSPQEFRHVAGLAHRVLARHLLRLANQDWEKNDAEGTGEELEASLEHYAAAVDWVKEGVAASLAARYEDWRKLAGDLHRGDLGWTKDQVRATLDGLGAELMKLSL
jgi:hypothetical protein